MQKFATVIALFLVALFLESTSRGATGPTATPSLVAEVETLTVTPTPTPTPRLITIDLKINSKTFLLALSEEQQQCVVTSVITEKLAELLQGYMDYAFLARELDPEVGERLGALQQRCFGDGSFHRAFLGILAKSLPEAAVPGGLGTVTLPDTAEEGVAAVERFPPEVAGKARAPQFEQAEPRRYIAAYGENPLAHSRFQALDVSSGFTTLCLPSCTAEHVVAMFALGADWEVLAAGRDGTLVWVYCATTMTTDDGPETTTHPDYSILWGEATSPWVFSAQADTPEGRDALVAAFVAATKKAGP